MTLYHNQAIETCDREKRVEVQTDKLLYVLNRIAKTNQFYIKKWKQAGVTDVREIKDIDDFFTLPLTTKKELVDDQEINSPFGTNISSPISDYVRLHQTSGTTGKPLKILDTAESWDWWLDCWSYVYRAANIDRFDRIYFAFSFGPFIGFWAGFEAATKVGAMAIAGGGLQTIPRLHAMIESECTALVCTPSYVMRLAETAAENNIDVKHSKIRTIICAGEPGASIPYTKKRIEHLWAAKCYDHTGMTEAGAIGFECAEQPGGIHLNEAEFIIEVIDPVNGKRLSEGEEGELVVTNLGRIGMPVVRYRTGDRVLLTYERCACGRTFVRAQGGIIGRVDDMIVVRGINVFPGAIENIIRQHEHVNEFQIVIHKKREMNEITINIELDPLISSLDTISKFKQSLLSDFQYQLSLSVDIKVLPAGSLPRFDLKAKRVTIVESLR